MIGADGSYSSLLCVGAVPGLWLGVKGLITIQHSQQKRDRIEWYVTGLGHVSAELKGESLIMRKSRSLTAKQYYGP